MLEKRFAKLRSITFKNKKKIVQEIKTHLYGREELMFAYIHGSFIREEAFRDIDIALYVRGSMNELFLESDLSYDLSRKTGHPVDVKIINAAPVAFQIVVLRDEKILFSHEI